MRGRGPRTSRWPISASWCRWRSSFGMKVLVTVNVLIKDTELSHLVDTLSALEELGVHAIIVQDLLSRESRNVFFPAFACHASTQMAVHNLAGVIQAWRFGFKRVVLARELTALEIKKIRASVPEDEIELGGVLPRQPLLQL